MTIKKVIFWTLVEVLAVSFFALCCLGCSTKITYKDFTYEKPIWSSQSIQRLEIWLDPNDPNKPVKFILEGQKSDAQAAVDLAEKIATGVITYTVGANPTMVK